MNIYQIMGVDKALIERTHRIGNEIREHDLYTYEHSARVAKYSVDLGIALGLTGFSCIELYIGGLLHDYGKVLVSRDLLNKKDKLTDLEYLELKLHPRNGHSLLLEDKIINRYKEILDIILFHHERIDGSGYPIGLKDNQISLNAKIVGIVDSYDAMTSIRTYNVPKSSAEAFEILKKCKLYDENLIKQFELVINKIS